MPTENSVETVYQGDTFRSYTVAELNNAPQAADATPVVNVYNPSGVLVASGEVNEGTPAGVYSRDIATTTDSPEGVWRAEWSYSVSGQESVVNDYFKVTIPVTTSGQQYCTASEIRDMAVGLDLSGLTDAQLDVWSIRLSALIDDYCQRRFGVIRQTETNDGIQDYQGRMMFYVNNLPIVEVHSINLIYTGQNTQQVPVDPDSVTWFNKRGYGRYYYKPWNRGYMLRVEYQEDFIYEIDYTGGGDVPQAIKQALVLMFENIYQPAITKAATGESAGLDNGGSGKTVKGYKSGTYEVSYDQGKGGAMYSISTGKIFTATVRDMLNHHAKRGQGTNIST